MSMLADYAARRNQSQSMIAEAAIASFLSPDAAERREAAIGKRLDQLGRRMARDIGIAVETEAVFVRFWLTTTPALLEPAAPARAKANERYEAFITALGRRRPATHPSMYIIPAWKCFQKEFFAFLSGSILRPVGRSGSGRCSSPYQDRLRKTTERHQQRQPWSELATERSAIAAPRCGGAMQVRSSGRTE